jgi:hypothetical protein
MHLWTTNRSTQTLDDCRVSFESTGALALDNEYSGFAVAPAHYIAFAERNVRHNAVATAVPRGLPSFIPFRVAPRSSAAAVVRASQFVAASLNEGMKRSHRAKLSLHD